MTGPFTPPARKALSDVDLAQGLEKLQATAGPLEALEFLKSENELRAADEIAFIAWIRAMEADGSAEALAALAAARAEHSGVSVETSLLESELKSTLEGDLAALGDWQLRAAEAEARRVQLEAEQAERLEAQRIEEEQAQARREAELQEAQKQAEEQAAAARFEAEQIALAAEKALQLELEQLELQLQQLEQAEAQLEEIQQAEPQLEEVEQVEGQPDDAESQDAHPSVTEEEVEPQRASDYATGSFDIIETAQVTIVDEVDSATFQNLLQQDELAFTEERKKQKPAFVEVARRSKALSQLFVWSGITVGVVPILLGAFATQSGLPILLVLGALALGFGISAVLIASGAVAGKRSGLQTLMLSRASLGVRGGSAVGIPVFVSKIFVGTVTVAVIGKQLFDGTVAGLPAFGSKLLVGSASVSWLQILSVALVVLAALFATLGGRVLYWLQWVSSIVGLLAIAAFAITAGGQFASAKIAFDAAISGPQVAQALALAGLLGAGLGAIWAASVADFTRQVPMSENGKKVALFVSLPVGVLSLLSAASGGFAYEAVKSSATRGVMTGLLSLLPEWAGSVLLIGGALQLLVWCASWLYSSSVSLRGLGVRTGRVLSQFIVLVLVIVVIAIGSSTSAENLRTSFLIASVILMAFAGVFVADVWRRKAAYDETSLRESFGYYGAVNWLNLAGFICAVVLGLAFVSTSLDKYFVTNFLGRYLSAIDFKDAQAGLLVALVVAALVPAAFGGKRIRGQEAKVFEVESRRNTFDSINLGSIQ